MDKSKYFSRTKVYTKQEDKVALLDKEDLNKTIPLEPWLSLVFSLADGRHTIGELIVHLESRYGGQPPADLHKTIASVIDRLLNMDALQLSDEAILLPYYLELPHEDQDIEKAREFMLQDGYINP